MSIHYLSLANIGGFSCEKTITPFCLDSVVQVAVRTLIAAQKLGKITVELIESFPELATWYIRSGKRDIEK